MHRGLILIFGLTACDLPWQLHEFEKCSPGEVFPVGTPVAFDGTYSVEAARFTPDQSVAYLSLCPTNASGNEMLCDLYTSTFVPKTQSFGFLSKLNGVSGPFYDAYPTVTPDGEYLLFASRETATTKVMIYVATAKNSSFEMPDIIPLPAAASASFANEPSAIGNDGQTIYFSAGFPAMGPESRLYRTTGGPPSYGTPELVPVVSTALPDNAPVVTDNELEIFFASSRDNPTVQPKLDGLDIYQASRASTAVPFDPPIRLTNLSHDGGPDWPVWISPDTCDLYYINKTNDVGTIYVSHR